jgi:hypothetical protein
MVLPYMMSNPPLVNRDTIESKTKAEQIRAKRRAIICLLLLAYIIVANIGYNLWTKGKSTPVRKLLMADVIRDLWKAGNIFATKPGTVMGILFSEKNSCALINHKLVYEGDITNGVKVVKINRSKVEFEKNGERWTQKVMANPNPAWKIMKSPTR